MEKKLIEVRKETIKSSIEIFGVEETIKRANSRVSLVAIEELLQEDKSIKEFIDSLSPARKIDLLKHLNSLKG